MVVAIAMTNETSIGLELPNSDSRRIETYDRDDGSVALRDAGAFFELNLTPEEAEAFASGLLKAARAARRAQSR
jgi:hypothetical protein